MNKTIKDFENYMVIFSKSYSDWYCGITSDPEQRLFNAHSVVREGGIWVYKDCGREEVARAIENYFLGQGCQGDTGGGNADTTYIYVYKITKNTVE